MRYLFYHGRITPEGVRNAEEQIVAAISEGEDAVTLCLASEGGDVNAGVGLFNFLGMVPIAIHTHAAGICASIAVTILLAGKRRTASPLSVFITHQATFVEGPLVGQRSPNTDLIAKPFRDMLAWNDEIIASRFGPADFVFIPPMAVDLGVVHEVVDLAVAEGDKIVPIRIP